MSSERSSVSLAFYGENLTPSELTEVLKCAPTKSYIKGDRTHPSADPLERGAWILNRKADSLSSIDSLIKLVLMSIPIEESNWEKLHDQYEIQLRIAIHKYGWNKGFDISAETIKWVSTIKADLVFDIYSYSEEDDT